MTPSVGGGGSSGGARSGSGLGTAAVATRSTAAKEKAGVIIEGGAGVRVSDSKAGKKVPSKQE